MASTSASTVTPEARPGLAVTAPPDPKRRRRRPISGYLYVLPALVVYVGFAVLPAIHSVYLSFYEWNGVGVPTPVGFEHYQAVLTDPVLRGALFNAFILVVFFAFIPIVLGLLLVALLARYRRRGMTAFRLIFFLPQIVPMVAVGIAWRWMYADDGALNELLRLVGLGDIARAWLGDFTWALPAVGLIGTWALTGLCMMLLLSGTQKIDPQLYEAVRLDGAGPVREFFAVTLPALRGEIAVALTITVIAALASFDVVYVSTNGAPGGTTNVPGLLVYKLAFNDGRVGVAAALAVSLTVLIMAIVLGINRIVRPQR